MNKFLALVCMTLLLQGCAVQYGPDNSFGAQASRDVKTAMAHSLCPYGEEKQDIEVRSRIEISKDSNSYYRDNSVQKYEEYSGRTRAKCLTKPVPVVNTPVPMAVPAPAKKK